MTVNLLTTPSCTSCRKAKQWLIDHEVDFKERNIFAQPLSTTELKQILMLSERGTEGLISTRSYVYEQYKDKINSLTIGELIKLLAAHVKGTRKM